MEPAHRSRVDRLRFRFSQLKIDALLVTSLPNIRYLCGFTGSAGLLLVQPHACTFFTDSRYTFQAHEEIRDAKIVIAKKSLAKSAAERLGRSGGLRIGFSEIATTVAQQRMLRAAFPKAKWKSDEGVIEELRSVKDASEIAIMRDAAVLISDVWQRVVNGIKPGLSELEVAARIEHGIKAKGGSGPSFDTIVAAGVRSAWAHAQPSLKPLAKNELVVLDQGAILRGYCSDLTRTVFVGKASQRVKHLYSAVLEAQAAAKAAIRSGVTAGDVDAAARRALQKHKLARYFTHSTGHGLGLEIHERPRLGRDDPTILTEGMVITVEPGVYVEGMGGIRIEDDVVVTANGYSELTTATRDFLEL